MRWSLRLQLSNGITSFRYRETSVIPGVGPSNKKSRLRRFYDIPRTFSSELERFAGYHKKTPLRGVAFFIWVSNGIRTHDPRYHKPML
jgi:hypothetical protein